MLPLGTLWKLARFFCLAGKPAETSPLSKATREDMEEEEENVQAVRKTTNLVIVSDDEIELEDIIEDSSPIKSKVCVLFFFFAFNFASIVN